MSETPSSPISQSTAAPIAIIGMGCIFPKARNLREFWRLLRTGADGITDVPPTHWRAEDYFDPDPKAPDMTYCSRGGFLSPVAFDPTEFGIPPAILEATDTTQLLGLVAAKAALEDAGYGDQREFDRERVNVIVGVTGTQELVLPLSARLGHPIWRRALAEAGVDAATAENVVEKIADGYVPWQENSFPGLLGNVVAGRIANRLNLRGTNCVVDAACASSISAIHMAVMELETRRCDVSVAGGADTLNDIFMYMCFSKTPALSPTGDARPFAADADGTVLGEGVGMIVLKRLADAERDGDRVYAVIRAIGTSSDGRSQSIYAPHAAGQARALRNAYRLAGFGPESVELVEAHGTGTKVGDATEYESLCEVFGEARREPGWCALGSVKSQIGHTKAAAGVAGMMKAALAIHHRALPPTIKVKQPNPRLANADAPFYLNTEARPWIGRDNQPRRAAVSAFGFGGSNFHAVLESPRTALPQPAWDGSVQIVALSANDRNELCRQADEWRSRAEAGELDGDWLAFRAAQSRRAFSVEHAHRLILLLEAQADPIPLLNAAASRLHESQDTAWELPHACYASGPPAGRLALVFPGQGSQYAGMLGELACTFPQLADALAEADHDVAGLDARLVDIIYPPPTFDDELRRRNADRLTRTEAAQPALGAVELGLARMLSYFGVRADAVAGHSFGELVALCAAGRIDAPSLHRLARLRGRLMGEGDADRGTMAAVKAAAEDVEAIVRDVGGDLILANRNGPIQSVISGPREFVASAVNACKARGFSVVPLKVSGAFHSRLMESAVQPFRNALEAVRISPGHCPVYSNTTARPYSTDSAEARRTLGEQLVRPVDWIGEVRAMYEDGVRTFIEVGPRAVLTGLIDDTLGALPHAVWSLDASTGQRSGLKNLAFVLARLAARGHAVDLTRWEFDAPEPRRPKMVVPLCGANYRNSSRSSAAATTTARPTHATAAAPPIAATDSSPVAVDPVAATTTCHQLTTAQSATEAPSACAVSDETGPNASPMSGPEMSQPLTPRSHSPAQGPAPVENPVAPAVRDANQDALPSAAMQQAMRLFQQGLAAMQQLQRETSEAHRLFLEGQESAHRTLVQLLEDQQHLLANTAPAAVSQPAVAPIAEVVRAAAPSSPATQSIARLAPAPVAPAPARPKAEPEPSVRVITPAPPAAPEPPAPRPLAEQVPASSPVVAAPASPAGSAGIEGTVIDVVCEKTGYPPDMIQLEMDLEADLGVDSIKRVEIVAALEEKLPGFGGVKPEQMGAIRTLRQIVNFIGEDVRESPRLPSPAPASSSSNSPATQTAHAVSPTAAPTAVEQPVAGTLLAVVSELTGYPQDMLDLAMDLEADLGIDSIKRVEILAAVESRIPTLPQVTPEQMGTLRTLGQIVDHLGLSEAAKVATQPESADPHSPSKPVDVDQRQPAESESAARGDLHRRVLVVRDLELAHPLGLDIAENHEVWITDDGGHLSAAIAERLTATGMPARVVPIDVRPAADARVGGLIVVAPPLVNAGVLWSREAEQLAAASFALLKALAESLQRAASSGGALVATVSRMDGAFGLGGGGAFDAALGALAGLPKTAAREWEGVVCRALDVARDWSDSAAAAAAIVDELCREAPIEVGLSPGARRGLELVPAQVIAGQPAISPGNVILISGGARGVTAEAAIALARRYRATLALLGRTELVDEPGWLAGLTEESAIKQAIRQYEFPAGQKPSPQELKRAFARYMGLREIRRNLRRIEDAGARVVYMSVDVCDAAGVKRAVDEITRSLGPVRGLIHGAGAIEDRRIVNKSQEQFDAVFFTKVTGLRSLLSAIDVSELRHLILFSSVSGRCGNLGQIDYSMANEVLNKAAQHLARALPACRAVSLNWGPWDGGMVHPALREEFRRQGIELIPLAAGGAAVADEISDASDPGVEVVLGSAFELARMSPTRRQRVAPSSVPLLQAVHPEPAPSSVPLLQAVHPEPAPSSVPLLQAEPPAPAAARFALNLAFERVLDPASHPFLYSHVVGGHAVLPAAIMIEWLSHAAVHALPGLRVQGADDFRVLRGVVIAGDAPRLRLYTAAPRRSGDVFDVETELRSVDPAGAETLHARATVVLTSRTAPPPPLDLPTGLAARPYPPGAEGAYAAEVLFHGPHLRVLSAIEGLSPAGLVAAVRTSDVPADWMSEPLHSDWLTSPAAIDAAFQAAIVWSVETLGAPCLPAAVRGFRQYAPMPRAGVTLYLQIRSSAPRQVVADAIFVAPGGALVARLEGCDCTVDAGLAEKFRDNSLDRAAHAG